jgi:flagellar assembly protein FliH
MAPSDIPCYCFPELDADPALRGPASAQAEANFRRSPVGSGAGACLPGAGGRRGSRLEDIEQQAYCRGYGDGERIGREQGEKTGAESSAQRIDPLLTSLEGMLAGLEELRRRTLEELEAEVVQLALAVARKITLREVRLDTDALAGILREALGRVELAEEFTVRMHPDDMARLSELKPRLIEDLLAAGRGRFEADPAIVSGGCLIETDRGAIDARLEQQLQVVEEAFRAVAQADHVK